MVHRQRIAVCSCCAATDSGEIPGLLMFRFFSFSSRTWSAISGVISNTKAFTPLFVRKYCVENGLTFSYGFHC